MTNDPVYEEYIKEGSIISREIYNLFIGDVAGAGAYRQVFANRTDPESVIKIETGGSSFENCMEWEIWKTIKDFPSIAKWFAPCLNISPCGTVLMQARCKPAPDSKYPSKVPKCFSDFKRENWGLYKGRLVCLDYGVHSTVILTEGIANCSKLKKADWWDNEV